MAGLVVDGYTNAEIGCVLCLSERTVDGHLESIKRKIHETRRVRVAMRLKELGYRVDGRQHLGSSKQWNRRGGDGLHLPVSPWLLVSRSDPGVVLRDRTKGANGRLSLAHLQRSIREQGWAPAPIQHHIRKRPERNENNLMHCGPYPLITLANVLVNVMVGQPVATQRNRAFSGHLGLPVT
jgi:hypothetical protein